MNKPANDGIERALRDMRAGRVVAHRQAMRRLRETVARAEIRLYDDAMRRLASGEDELVPAETVNRILDGENAVRVWREYRGLTLKQLAELAGVSAPFVSQIEGGQREGSLETMRKIATVLKVSLDDLT